MTIVFFIPDISLNDATSYYVNLVMTACNDLEISTRLEKHNNFSLEKGDFVFTITTREFTKVFIRLPSSKHIFWSQGLVPEEQVMIHNYSLKSVIKSKLHEIIEKFVLKKSEHVIMVSERMQEHFEKKYKLRLTSTSIIPCYNKNLNKDFFKQSRKKPNSYVFAGSLYAWQCFEKTLDVYKIIEEKNQNATLTILTKDSVIAEESIRLRGIKNFEIKYIPLKDLDTELAQYKYGFLLRDSHIINEVSTPTKMNTYLSAGLIPIYTDVIASFEKHLNLKKYGIKLNSNLSVKEIAKTIITHNANDVDYEKFYDLCLQNYEGYYDDSFNKTLILKNLKHLIPS